jgi:hypothetical protein
VVYVGNRYKGVFIKVIGGDGDVCMISKSECDDDTAALKIGIGDNAGLDDLECIP